MATFYMTAESELYHTGLGYDGELMHYGILGMKWGVRRYQNKDGSLTAEGKIKYGTVGKKMSKSDSETYRKVSKSYNNLIVESERNDLSYIEARKKHEKALKKYGQDSVQEKKARLKRTNYGLTRQVMHEELYNVMTKLQEKYGTSRVKDIPTKTTKYGEITYRKLMNTPELSNVLTVSSVGSVIATLATGSLYIPNSFAIPFVAQSLRKSNAKAYAKKREKEFYKRTGRKMDDLSWYNNKRRVTVNA